MRQVCFMAMAAAVLLLSGCAGGGGSRAAVGGGILSPQVAAAATSGGLVSQTGVDLSRSELAAAIAAEQRALESAPAGQAVDWQGTDGRNGTVIAAQPYRVGSQDCRPYSHVVKGAGPARSVRGTACRNPDGSWSLLN